MTEPIRIPTRRKVLFAAILVLFALVLCEGPVRVRQWIRYGGAVASVRDPMVVYDEDAQLNVPKPGFEVKGARIHIQINSLGFRGDEFSRAKPENTVRIACLGASTTFC